MVTLFSFSFVSSAFCQKWSKTGIFDLLVVWEKRCSKTGTFDLQSVVWEKGCSKTDPFDLSVSCLREEMSQDRPFCFLSLLSEIRVVLRRTHLISQSVVREKRCSRSATFGSSVRCLRDALRLAHLISQSVVWEKRCSKSGTFDFSVGCLREEKFQDWPIWFLSFLGEEVLDRGFVGWWAIHLHALSAQTYSEMCAAKHEHNAGGWRSLLNQYITGTANCHLLMNICKMRL